MVELKPCPLCGGKAELWEAHPENPKRQAWIACMERCCAFITREHPTDEAAIAAWNHRTEALSRTGAVEVKALEWRGSETERMIAFAEFGGAYGISVYAGMPEPFKVETYGWWSGEPCGHYATLDEAKAAAQADYERRILSALSQPLIRKAEQ